MAETLNRSGQVLREQEDKITLAQSQQADITGELDTLAGRIEETYTAINTCSVQMEELRNQAASDEESAARLEGEISVLENDIQHAQQDIERIQEEIERSVSFQKDLSWEIASRQTEMQVKEREAKARETEFEQAAGSLEDLRRSADEAARQVDSLSVQLAEKNTALSEARVQATSADSTLREILSRQESIHQTLSARQEQKAKCSRKFLKPKSCCRLPIPEWKVCAMPCADMKCEWNPVVKKRKSKKRQMTSCIWIFRNSCAGQKYWKIWKEIWKALPRV